MSDAFRTKAQHFAQQVISDVKANVPTEQAVQAEQPNQQQQPLPIAEPSGNEPQAYHEEKRLSEFGSVHIDFFFDYIDVFILILYFPMFKEPNILIQILV